MRRIGQTTLAACLAMSALALQARAADVSARALAVLSSRQAAQGDADGQLALWLAEAGSGPDTVLGELALRLALSQDQQALGEPAAVLPALLGLVKRLPAGSASRGLAAKMLVRALARAGRWQEAAEWQAARGGISSWLVIGPFGCSAHASFYEEFAPESGLGLEVSAPGAAGPVRWRALAPRRSLPALNPWEEIAPAMGVVYLLARFRLGAERPALVEIDTECSFRLWMDNVNLLTVDRFQSESAREQAVEVLLPQGWHQLLLKVYAGTSNREIAVRLVDPRSGEALAPEAWETGLTTRRVADPAKDQEARPVPLLIDRLQAWSGESAARPVMQAALALACRDQGLLDDGLFWLRQAAQREPDNPWLLALLADMEAIAPDRGDAQRDNQAAAALRRALVARPDFVPALVGLAGYALQRRQYGQAVILCEQALAASPRCLAALALRARIAVEQGWPLEADRWVSELVGKWPMAPASLALSATRALLRNDCATLDAAYASLARQNHDRPYFALRQLQALLRSGGAGAAAAHADKLAGAYADDAHALSGIAEVQQKLGRLEEARKTCRRGLELMPGDAGLWKQLGELAQLADDDEEALSAFERSLELKPEQHDLRKLVASLGGASPDFWAAYAQDVQTALANPAADSAKGGGTVRIVDQVIIQVYPDGSYSSLTHELVKVLHRGGIDEAANVGIYGELVQARTILPDGTIKEPVRIPGRDQLTMPDVDVGAAIDCKYLLETPAQYDRAFLFPKWYFRSPNNEEEFLFSHMVVRVPKGYPLVFAERNFHGQIEFSQKTEGDWIVYAWTGRNMPHAVHEADTPHIDETLPFIEVGGRRTWRDINLMFMNAYLGRLRPSRSLREAVARLCPAGLAAAEQVRALHAFVCREIDHRTGGTNAAQILSQRAGDRNILLLALLRTAGLDANYVAVRPPAAMLHEPTWEIPQLGHFPLRMILVRLQDGRQIWLDTRYRTLACGELLDDTAGATAFVVGPHAGTFHTIPPCAADGFATEEERLVTLPADPGQAVPVKVRRVLRGSAAHERAELLREASDQQRAALVEDDLAPSLPGITSCAINLPDLDAACSPLVQSCEVAVEALVEARVGNGRAAPLCLTPLDLLPESEDAPDARETPFHLARYVTGTDTITFELPPGAIMHSLPSPLTIRNDFGFYELRCRQVGASVEVHRRYQFCPQRIGRDTWPLFLDMVRSIDDAERRSFVYAQR